MLFKYIKFDNEHKDTVFAIYVVSWNVRITSLIDLDSIPASLDKDTFKICNVFVFHIRLQIVQTVECHVVEPSRHVSITWTTGRARPAGASSRGPCSSWPVRWTGTAWKACTRRSTPTPTEEWVGLQNNASIYGKDTSNGKPIFRNYCTYFIDKYHLIIEL